MAELSNPNTEGDAGERNMLGLAGPPWVSKDPIYMPVRAEGVGTVRSLQGTHTLDKGLHLPHTGTFQRLQCRLPRS